MRTDTDHWTCDCPLPRESKRLSHRRLAEPAAVKQAVDDDFTLVAHGRDASLLATGRAALAKTIDTYKGARP